jgi:hypothetical protein
MPWVFHGTIKDNIVAGEPFDDTWFSIILWACCLDIDVRHLSNGINTPAGENGSNLSGGQKSRVVGHFQPVPFYQKLTKHRVWLELFTLVGPLW